MEDKAYMELMTYVIAAYRLDAHRRPSGKGSLTVEQKTAYTLLREHINFFKDKDPNRIISLWETFGNVPESYKDSLAQIKLEANFVEEVVKSNMRKRFG